MNERRRTKDERRETNSPKPGFLLLHKAHTQINKRINKNKVLYKEHDKKKEYPEKKKKGHN
jgi:hypothetical protein